MLTPVILKLLLVLFLPIRTIIASPTPAFQDGFVSPTFNSSFTSSSTSCPGLVCTISIVSTDYQDRPDEQSFLCTLDRSQEPENRTGFTYPIDLPNDFIGEHIEELDLGRAKFCIINATIVASEFQWWIEYPINASGIIEMIQADIDSTTNEIIQGAHTKRTIGVRSILVVRTVTPFGQPQASTSKLAGSIFGLGPDPFSNSMAAQYERCSFGQLMFVPATGHNAIEDGVMEIQLSTPTTGKTIQSLVDLIKREVEDILGGATDGLYTHQFDHVIHCLPFGSIHDKHGHNWVAQATINGAISVINSAYCDSLTVLQHEIGHNLGFSHSSQASRQYGDDTGVMGKSLIDKNGPIQCFNGAKNWITGWYASKSIDISSIIGNDSSSLFWIGNLTAFVDFDRTSTADRQYVLIKLNNLYIQFNRAKRFNIGTREAIDRVTVVSQENKISQLRAHLGEGQQYKGDGYTIEVCTMQVLNYDDESTDYAELSIYVDGTRSGCLESVVVSESPSMFPSTEPTRKPSNMPTVFRSDNPTVRPSVIPTELSSAFPTQMPSIEPTNMPTVFRSDNPTVRPSVIPTELSSSSPTEFPSTNPTAQPTIIVTSSPTPLPSFIPTPLPSFVASVSPTSVLSWQPSSDPSVEPTPFPSLRPSDGICTIRGNAICGVRARCVEYEGDSEKFDCVCKEEEYFDANEGNGGRIDCHPIPTSVSPSVSQAPSRVPSFRPSLFPSLQRSSGPSLSPFFLSSFSSVVVFGVEYKRSSTKDLSFSSVRGTIPRELGYLIQLTYLNFYNNALTGTIPRELGYLTQLTYLSLISNALTGTIPESVCNRNIYVDCEVVCSCCTRPWCS